MNQLIDVRAQMTNPQGRFKTNRNALTGVAVHHSVGGDYLGEDASEAAELAQLQAIDHYHVGLDYGGIGYHLAAFASGRLYQLGDLDAARAHVAGRNHELLGIVAIGTFTERMPGLRQVEALRQGIAHLCKAAGRQLVVKGHGAWALPGEGTACPGLLGGFDWASDEVPPVAATHAAMHRFNGVAASLEGRLLDAGARSGVLKAAAEFALPAEARCIRLEVALLRGGFAVGDGTYAGRVDERYGARLGIIDAMLRPDGSLLFDCPPGTVIERVGCLGYWC
ncbi:MAG: peptidoglycan recognition family protein [Dehalococcoidia bacterium]